jgi:hypothetical protein
MRINTTQTYILGHIHNMPIQARQNEEEGWEAEDCGFGFILDRDLEYRLEPTTKLSHKQALHVVATGLEVEGLYGCGWERISAGDYLNENIPWRVPPE